MSLPARIKLSGSITQSETKGMQGSEQEFPRQGTMGSPKGALEVPKTTTVEPKGGDGAAVLCTKYTRAALVQKVKMTSPKAG